MEKIKKGWKKTVENFKSNKLKDFYLKKEGGKNRLRYDRFFVTLSLLTGPLCVCYLFSGGNDTSYIGRSPNSLMPQNQDIKGTSPTQPINIPTQKNGYISGNEQPRGAAAGRPTSIKLAAKQVIVREDGSLGYGFHPGSNLIGELQSTIDTRDPSQIVRVALPFGGRSKDGSSEIPKGTILMGQVTYPGKGEKVFITFQQAVFPEGKTIKMAAQALDPKDYSSGLNGEIQSQAKSRAMTVLGLSMVSAMGNVLTEKESMGQFQVEPKANMNNALLTGAAKAAEVEAGRLQDQTQAQDFVRVEAGTVVIVSLTQGLNL